MFLLIVNHYLYFRDEGNWMENGQSLCYLERSVWLTCPEVVSNCSDTVSVSIIIIIIIIIYFSLCSINGINKVSQCHYSCVNYCTDCC